MAGFCTFSFFVLVRMEGSTNLLLYFEMISDCLYDKSVLEVRAGTIILLLFVCKGLFSMKSIVFAFITIVFSCSLDLFASRLVFEELSSKLILFFLLFFQLSFIFIRMDVEFMSRRLLEYSECRETKFLNYKLYTVGLGLFLSSLKMEE